MSKVSKKAAKGSTSVAQTNGSRSKFARAKAVARIGLNTADTYANLVNAVTTDYILDSEYPDPRIIFSGVGKRVAIANAQLRASALLGKGTKNGQFFLNS